LTQFEIAVPGRNRRPSFTIPVHKRHLDNRFGTGGDAGSPAAAQSVRIDGLNDRGGSGSDQRAPGLKTEYDDRWIGRYQALKSEIRRSTSTRRRLACDQDFWRRRELCATEGDAHQQRQLTGALTQGYGQLAQAGDLAAVLALSGATSGLDSLVTNKADDWSWGWNIGAMFSFNGDANNEIGASRVGLAYRSKIKYKLTGDADFNNPTVPTLGGPLAPFNPAVRGVSAVINQTRLFNSGITIDVEVPDTASLSYYYKLSDPWEFLADITWTGWSSIKEISIVRTTGTTLGVLPQMRFCEDVYK
jgi:long-chain fatty acid transport protein